MLEKDKQDFNHYLDENKRASEQAQQKAEEEGK